MRYCKRHKANPPILSCNECFPIDGYDITKQSLIDGVKAIEALDQPIGQPYICNTEPLPEDEITDTNRLNWLIDQLSDSKTIGIKIGLEFFKAPREAIDAAMAQEKK